MEIPLGRRQEQGVVLRAATAEDIPAGIALKAATDTGGRIPPELVDLARAAVYYGAPRLVQLCEAALAAAAEARAAWQADFDAWAAANPERKALLDRLGITEEEARLLLGGN